MGRALTAVSLALFASAACRADVCNPRDFAGPYGFLLAGNTTISGSSKAVASVGRVVANGTGQLSGYSSVNFAGLFLGNPVTGTYAVQTNCSIKWSLQDDSGAFQNFEGTMSADGRRVQFRQSGSGSPRQGAMVRTGESCSAAQLRGRYRFAVSGTNINMDTGHPSGEVNAKGMMDADGSESLQVAPGPDAAGFTGGTFRIEDGCFVQLELARGAQEAERPGLKFRAILVNAGRELLGIESDPGTTVTVKLTAE